MGFRRFTIRYGTRTATRHAALLLLMLTYALLAWSQGTAAAAITVTLRVDPIFVTDLGDRVTGPVTIVVEAPGADAVVVLLWPVDAPVGGRRVGPPRVIASATHAADRYAFAWPAEEPDQAVELVAVAFGPSFSGEAGVSDPVTLLLDWR